MYIRFQKVLIQKCMCEEKLKKTVLYIYVY